MLLNVNAFLTKIQNNYINIILFSIMLRICVNCGSFVVYFWTIFVTKSGLSKHYNNLRKNKEDIHYVYYVYYLHAIHNLHRHEFRCIFCPRFFVNVLRKRSLCPISFAFSWNLASNFFVNNKMLTKIVDIITQRNCAHISGFFTISIPCQGTIYCGWNIKYI